MNTFPKTFHLSTNHSALLGPFDATILDTMEKGTGSHSVLHQTVVSFTLEEGKDPKYAIGIPGRMYVNGTDNFLKYAKTNQLVNGCHEKFSWKVWVRQMRDPLYKKLNLDAELMKQFKDTRTAKRNQENKERINCSYYIVMMAPKGYDKSPEDLQSSMNTGKIIKTETSSFTKFWNHFLDSQFEEVKIEKDSMDSNWFLLSDVGLTGYSGGDIDYDMVKQSVEMKGTIKNLILPFGGTIELENGELALFHKKTVVNDGYITGFMDQLNVKVGSKVDVMTIPNMKDEKEIIHGFDGKFIATKVFAGKRDAALEMGQVGKSEMIATKLDGQGHKIIVIEMYENEEGFLDGGLGVLQYSPMIRMKKASESMVGEYVKFEGKNIYFCGCSLSGIDLAHLIRVGDTIDVILTMLETKEDNAQYAVKFGHIGSLPPEDVLMPEGTITTKRLLDRNLDFDRAEKILLKRVGPVSKSMPADTALGRIIQLEKPENKETCCKGTVLIETGKHRGKKVKLNRNKLSVLGLSLANADLLYCVSSHEAVYVDVNGIDDYPEGVFVPKFGRLISPFECTEVTGAESLSAEDKSELIQYLHQHGIDYQLFKQVLAGTAPNRYFIPFPKFCFPQYVQGHVTNLETIVNPKNGCIAGTVHVDTGYLTLDKPGVDGKGIVNMKDEKVSFVRSNFWVFGRKCAKADLTYLITPNQRVNLEVELISDEDREKIADLAPSVKYKATCIWVGPARPRNDKDDPNKNDVSIFDWLSKRGLDIKQFKELLDGNLPAHRQMELDMNNFFLPPMGDNDGRKGKEAGFGQVAEPVQDLPVLRHGTGLANMLEQCIVAAGPLDPRLMMLIQNDDQAQAAFHVSEALKFALTHYRERTNQPYNGLMGGRGGPPMGQGLSSWGPGGNKRPAGSGNGFGRGGNFKRHRF